MKRMLATLTGVGLAAGLALAAPAGTSADLVTRYFAASDAAGIAASWHDWHPEAVNSITVKYGQGLPDDHFSYAVADYETLPNWQDDPVFADAMRGYAETTSGAPEFSEGLTDEGTFITAVTRVGYTWDGYTGQMTKTDRFTIIAYLGASAIRSLDTTYDYR